MATGLQKATAVLFFVAFICSIVALAVPYWLSGSGVNEGLWSACYDTNEVGTVCSDITDASLTAQCQSGTFGSDSDACLSSFKAVRAFAVLAFIFAFFALVTAMAAFFAGKGPVIAPVGCAAVAGFCSMIAFAIFVAKFKVEGIDFGAGVAFAIITWLLEWAGAGLALVSGKAGTGGGSASG